MLTIDQRVECIAGEAAGVQTASTIEPPTSTKHPRLRHISVPYSMLFIISRHESTYQQLNKQTNTIRSLIALEF